LGCRVATSTNGSITGKGYDLIIVDDAMNPEQALSETQRERCLNWCSSSLFSRFDDTKMGRMINIQHRLHEKDFTGHFCGDNWEHLVIPVYFEKPKTYSISSFKKEVQAGEYLHEERFGENECKDKKTELGSYSYAGQYEQNPTPLGGGMIKEKWFRYWKILPQLEFRKIFVDTAMKTGEENDFSVFECWGLGVDKNAYLIDQLKGKWEAPDLTKMAVAFWNKHKMKEGGALRKMVVEDKVSGTGLIQTLKKEYRIPIEPVKPDKDKVVRVNDIVGYIESGYIYLPEEAEFVSDFLHECSLFPNGAHDDQVDVLAYAVNSLFVKKPTTVKSWGRI
jgi:predicted phage terminase large subunit-like protein